jgi:hypothetical protein
VAVVIDAANAVARGDDAGVAAGGKGVVGVAVDLLGEALRVAGADAGGRGQVSTFNN